ncbi:UNKNOWN [Stylonychia lemnae]|uniref:Uncharacterized protein n=1 Tax=Stylonychia lemnae TaxID=5949 RepID=A0A078AY72_STYLE|nr:UNKNOWN [Stylonychia lemnae]|eukprot:CDW87071.1 UNKNOWN [Stylonychia lemnae]
MERYLNNSKLNASTNLSRTPNKSIMSHLTDPTNHQGSSSDLDRALSTYLNPVGPGQYNLKSLIGNQIIEGPMRNGPCYSLKKKTNTSWFPEMKVDFQGKDSPGFNHYSPSRDNQNFKNVQFSVGKQDRFFEQTHIKVLKSNLPIQYQPISQEQSDKYNKISIGFGQKMHYKISKEDETTPGPIYNTHEIASISHVNNVPSKLNSSFGNKYDKWDKVQYHGAEAHFYGREGLGPGAYYNDHDKVTNLNMKSSQMYSLPKGDRGLLRVRKENSPGPQTYNADQITFKKRYGSIAMPQASRDFHFAKYNSLHQTLVQKGIY